MSVARETFFDLFVLPLAIGGWTYLGWKAAKKRGYGKSYLAVLGGAAYFGVRALRRRAK